MNESNSKPEKPKDCRFSQEQYDMLKRCSDKEDMTEWNEWREQNPDEDVLLEKADFSGCYLNEVYLHTGPFGYPNEFKGKIHLEGANFEKADLEEAQFNFAQLEKTQFVRVKLNKAGFDRACLVRATFYEADLSEATLANGNLTKARFLDSDLKNANFNGSDLRGAEFDACHLQSTQFRVVLVDGATRLWYCEVNQPSAKSIGTDFRGASLGNCRITQGTRQLLEYNIRRMNWEEWYDDENEPIRDEVFIFSNKKIRLMTNKILTWLVRKFWKISDYGISTKGIIKTFFKWAVVFAIVYYAWGCIDYYLLSNKDYPGIVSNLFVLEDSKQVVSGWLVPFRAVYFSIVTMTTLGFGDMYASAHSLFRGIFGHILLALQVILGYVLLGALVTRFAVLFTAGGPAGKFADEKEKEDKK
ncbi:MAG: pentapeptide repeat-containing protein [Sedimentisphaerales bacterium]